MSTAGAVSQALDDLLAMVDATHFTARQKQSVRASLHAIQKLVIAQADDRVVVAAGHLALAFKGLLDEGARPDFDTEDLMHKLKFTSVSAPFPSSRTGPVSSTPKRASVMAMPQLGNQRRSPRPLVNRYSMDMAPNERQTRHSPLRQPPVNNRSFIEEDDSEEFDEDEDDLANSFDNPFVQRRYSQPVMRPFP
ncbi:hypothetical protein DIURU_003866 [Diutina rugosa]|uniref:Uncharacterized protein n=1 Tax=Diutina rugosa TaxID=5481 RepID=A0A642UJU8_DIURU|nr:uncharacterized protein DIURU_003866 [Diutina rugosa]KAA8900285.1 hypothetical protein DIURU_003866 [Diutina rugosa]